MGLVFDLVEDKILNQHFTNLFRPAYVRVKGTTLPKRFIDFHETIDNFEVYDDDLWICSFPKTGTTWTQEMIWMILNDFNFEEGQKCLGERFPFLDYAFLFDYRDVHKQIPNFDAPQHFEKSIEFIQNLKRPRLIKTHLPWNLLPKQIQNGSKRPKMVYVARNPQDTCLSYFHHCKLIEGYTGDFFDFTQLFLAGNLCFAPYWNNVLPYWQKRNEDNFLFLKYEDLKQDLSHVIRKVASFLSKELNSDQVSILVDHLSFESMKKNKGVNYESVVQLHKKHKFVDCSGSFVRSGTVGRYKLEFSEELKMRFDSWIKKHAPGLGY